MDQLKRMVFCCQLTIKVGPFFKPRFILKNDILNICYSKNVVNVISGNSSGTSLPMTYSNWVEKKTKTYLTVLKLNENRNTRSNMITIDIGNKNDSDIISNTDYQNGPLTNQDYR